MSLGSDRVQRVYASADGTWAAAIFKVRGAATFGFITIDLAHCEPQAARAISGVPTAAEFSPTEVALTLSEGVRRFPLANTIFQ